MDSYNQEKKKIIIGKGFYCRGLINKHPELNWQQINLVLSAREHTFLHSSLNQSNKNTFVHNFSIFDQQKTSIALTNLYDGMFINCICSLLLFNQILCLNYIHVLTNASHQSLLRRMSSQKYDANWEMVEKHFQYIFQQYFFCAPLLNESALKLKPVNIHLVFPSCFAFLLVRVRCQKLLWLRLSLFFPLVIFFPWFSFFPKPPASCFCMEKYFGWICIM